MQLRRDAPLRAPDHVFGALARAILNGELAPGTVLASQATLAEQFRVSTLVVRQAIHRLEELELVHVRQGSTTTVRDPREATDIRLLQLQLELALPGDRFAVAAIEQRALFPLALLTLAERRITGAELQQLEAIVDALPEAPTPQQLIAMRLQFWSVVARATRNGVIQQQIRWWASVVRSDDARSTQLGAFAWIDDSAGVSREFFKAMLGSLRRRRGAASLWLKTIGAQLDRA